MQVINPARWWQIPFVDLRMIPEYRREEEACRIIGEDARRPFDLERGPLLRVRLLCFSDTDYRLFLTPHHIVFDGTSIYRVFLPTLIRLYEAFAAGDEPHLPDPPLQYADFAAWQRRAAINPQSIEFWRNNLSGELPSLALPTDHCRPARQRFRGAMHRFRIPAAITDSMRSLALGEGATLFMALLATLKVLLYRYSGQEDIIIGTVTAGRKRSELGQVMGYFLNTVPLRTQLSATYSFRELLKRVRETVLEAVSHDDVPFQEIVRHVQSTRDLSRNPIFQVMFSLEPPIAPVAEDWNLTQVEVESGAAKFDLCFELDERNDGIIGKVAYDTDLFEPSTIARMLEHYENLLQAFSADPDRPIGLVTFLTSREQHTTYLRSPYPQSCVSQIFEAQALRRPDASAVSFGNSCWGFSDLNRRANRVANAMIESGVETGEKVGVCLDRSPEAIVAFLAILKAGAAYVPLDPALPVERIAIQMKQAGVHKVVTTSVRKTTLPCSVQEIILLEEAQREFVNDENPHVFSRSPEDIACLMFTSGSAGIPKAVSIPHRAIIRLVVGNTYASLDETEIILHMAPHSFDASLFEIWGALLNGGCSAIAPENLSLPGELGEVLRKHQVSTLWLTSSLFNLIVDLAPQELASVQQLLIGGEALSVAHVRRALPFLKGTRLINAYGPTENSTFTCTYAIPPEIPPSMHSVPIGKPIANTYVRILDKNMQLVPTGVPGELYAGGDGLALGYLNDPQLTSDRFVPDPFLANSRIYRTGDIARYLEDGYIDFIGRVDDQVKVRGFRIELGEVNSALLAHDSVAMSATLPVILDGGTELTALVSPKPERSLSVATLRDHLQRHLPKFMLPSRIEIRDSLSLSTRGKIDKATSLCTGAEKEHSQPGASEQIPSADEIEERMRCLWEELLNCREIPREADFFCQGGHSLLAARLLVRIEREFGARVSVRDFVEHPTIKAPQRQFVRGQELLTEPSRLLR